MSTLTDHGGRPPVAEGDVTIISDYKSDTITAGVGRKVGARWLDLPHEQAQLLARKLFGALPPARQPLSPLTVRIITRALTRHDAPSLSDQFANEKALADFRRLIGGEDE